MYSGSNYDCHIMESFEFESGKVLENVTVEYLTRGIPKYDEDGNIINMVIYFPTLKGSHSVIDDNLNVIKEWDLDTSQFFIIRITTLGVPDSCSPSSTGLKYDFPQYTLKDRVNFKKQFLDEKFKIKKIFGLIGEGIGGFELYTWACEYPEDMEFLIILNSTFKTYGYRYVFVKTIESIIDSSEYFYSDEYNVSFSKLIVSITRLMFAGYFSKNIFEQLSNDEVDVLMDDYVDEGLFMDIHDFKFRNDCILQYDVEDKLSNIEAKTLLLGVSGYLFYNTGYDILYAHEKIKNSTFAIFEEKESFYDDYDYSEMGVSVKSFLEQFKK